MNAQLCLRWLTAPVCLSTALVLTGCGMQAAPQPPSLELPNPVVDLHAARTGDQVALTWTMPRRTTDKVLLTAKLPVTICRNEAPGACQPAGAISLAPGVAGSFTDALPPALASGPPRPLTYWLDLKNRRNRSAGPSNSAVVLAGEAPAAVVGLTASTVKTGVMLRWQPVAQSTPSAVRLERKLLSAPPAQKPSGDLMNPTPAPAIQNLLVAADAKSTPLDAAVDSSIQFGQSYQYRAQRVAQVTINGQSLELDGPFSAPVSVDARDVFPPAVPSGLAAVANPPAPGSPPSVDLSWNPDTDPNLAGYVVYRREGGGVWQRISPAEPVPGPAFHDADVLPQHTYTYAVSAVSQNGYASARSAETSESVPGQ